MCPVTLQPRLSSQLALADIHEMISLANRLISQSINPFDPIVFWTSAELCDLPDNPSDGEVLDRITHNVGNQIHQIE